MPRTRLVPLLVLLSLVAIARTAVAADAPARPNVILIITDDQGYGDVAAHGNTMIQTPNMDRLHGESVRLTDFHVDPTCAPTRSALMTGRYSLRIGVWHTIMGRSMLRAGETTMAEVFHRNGYATAMYGKWHLGDNYPFRPEQRGFDEVFRHGGGGVGQTPDYFGNDYFDDTYFNQDGETVKCEGYCTDIWFDHAKDFIKRHKNEPFFVYLATNAPHGPYLVDEKYSKPYADQGVPNPMDKFYGMITNIDENLGAMREMLDELKIADDTILVFMTDNGTAAGVARNKNGAWQGFNDGMRGQKGSEYDGGHRVPCFFHWPNGDLVGGRDVDELTAHIDMLPTLVDLCGLDEGKHRDWDGTSVASLLKQTPVTWPDRTLFVESHRIDWPEKWRKSTVMTDRWRYVNDQELYDIQADPGQTNNVIEEHPEVAKRLAGAYNARWEALKPTFEEYARIVIGDEHENLTLITSHDWHGQGVPWNHGAIMKMPAQNGYWAIDVAADGKYRFTLRHRPDYEVFPLQAKSARLKIGDAVDVARDVPADATGVTFEVDLKKGPAMLQTWLIEADGTERGAYYIDAELLN